MNGSREGWDGDAPWSGDEPPYDPAYDEPPFDPEYDGWPAPGREQGRGRPQPGRDESRRGEPLPPRQQPPMGPRQTRRPVSPQETQRVPGPRRPSEEPTERFSVPQTRRNPEYRDGPPRGPQGRRGDEGHRGQGHRDERYGDRPYGDDGYRERPRDPRRPSDDYRDGRPGPGPRPGDRRGPAGPRDPREAAYDGRDAGRRGDPAYDQREDAAYPPEDSGPQGKAHPVVRVAAGSARIVGRTGAAATQAFRRYTHSGGAGETGLATMTEMHASHTAGDAAMMLALAGTLFFDPSQAEARGSVAMFLIMTMVPFALVAPLIGPLLDKYSHGRRWAIGATLAVRAFLCWVLAEATNNDSSWLYPAALGCLVASRAYNITRSAATARLLPRGQTLVNANSKIGMAGVIGTMVGGILGGMGMVFGAAWALRVAFVIFIVGTIQAILLPAHVDSSAGELRPEDTHVGDGSVVEKPFHGSMAERIKARFASTPWAVQHAMWTTGGTRILTGFLIMYMAFLAKGAPIDGIRGEMVLGLVLGGAGVGQALASLIGNMAKNVPPERLAMLITLAAMVSCIAVALWYAVWTIILVGLLQGTASQLAKLCLDALIQRDVPERVQTSVFAWSETILQILWVIGGFLGIMLPLNPHIGFPVAAVAVAATIVQAARVPRTPGRGGGMPGRGQSRGPGGPSRGPAPRPAGPRGPQERW